MQDFKKLDVWRESHRLAMKLYSVSKKFPLEERYGVTSQLRRAVISVPTNIAEGCGRKTEREFSRFLQIASGSASELEYLLILTRDLGYLSHSQSAVLSDEIIRIRKMLFSLMKIIQDP